MEGVRHTRYGWWLEEAGPVEATAPLDGDTTADVVIAGGGYLGLWTAWHLKELEPSLDVVVLEAGLAGHGPSGRNGGFVSTLWDDLPDPARPRRRRARTRRRARVRARCPRDRRVVRAHRSRCLVPRCSDALRRDERGPARLLRRRDRGVRRARRRPRRSARSAQRSCAAAATRLPRRRDPPDVRDRPPGPALARPSGEGDRGGRPASRADDRPAPVGRRGRRHPARPRPRRGGGARGQQRHGRRSTASVSRMRSPRATWSSRSRCPT